MKDFTGITMPSITGTGLGNDTHASKEWFGGQDNLHPPTSESIIMAYLDDAFDAIDENDVDIDCEPDATQASRPM